MTLREKEALVSDLNVAAIQQRAEQATPGPWKAEDIGAGTVACGVVAESGRVIIEHDFVAPNNAEFIAHARTDVPALLAHLALLEAQQTAQTWQPIETALKDGTSVLVYDDGAICIAAFVEGHWYDMVPMMPPPSHWMPLPPAPSPKEPQP